MNLSAMTVSDLYQAGEFRMAQIYLAVSVGIYSILLPPTLYIVLTQANKNMALYKNLLALQLLIGYAFVCLRALFLPLRFSPTKLMCYCGWVSVGPHTAVVLASLFPGIVSLLGATQVWLVVYRVVSIFNSAFHERCRRFRTLVLGVVGATMFALAAVQSVLCSIDLQVDYRHVQALTVADVPGMKEVLRRFPNAIGYHPAITLGGYHSCVISSRIHLLASVLVLLVGAVVFVLRLRYIKRYVSHDTYLMHKNLFTITILQSLCFGFLFVLPNFRIFTVIVPQSLGDCMLTLQLLVDILTILIGIKDYRRFVYRKVFNVINTSVSHES